MSFKPGQSGNPRGRPPGSKNKRTVVSEKLDQAAPDVTDAVITAAKGGDMSAASLVLTRVHPPLRPRAEKVVFDLDPDADCGEQAKQIVLAVSRGEVDPDTGKMILDMLSAMVGLRDVETFLDELKALRESKRVIPGGVVTT